MLLIAQQLQCLGFLAQQAWQPVAQLGGTLAIATVVAPSGPAKLQQPQRGLQREQAPAWAIEFGGEVAGRALADRFVVLAGFDAWAPVLDQRVEQLAQFTAAGARCGLAEAAEQGAQVDQLLQPLAEQFPVAVEAVLLGQALAVAQQVPGQRGEGVVQRHACLKGRCGQAQRIAVSVVQAITAFGLADVAGHQRQVGGQFAGQLQQRFGLALAQFQFQLADFLGVLADQHLAQVQRRFDHDPGLAAAPGDLGLFANEVGGEDRFEGFLVQFGECRRPAVVGELLRVQLGLVQIPVPLVALGQAGYALASALQRLDELIAVAAQAQRDFRLSQFTPGRVVVLIEQFVALPAALVAFLQQRVVAQGREGFATGAQFDFGFFLHVADRCLYQVCFTA